MQQIDFTKYFSMCNSYLQKCWTHSVGRFYAFCENSYPNVFTFTKPFTGTGIHILHEKIQKEGWRGYQITQRRNYCLYHSVLSFFGKFVWSLLSMESLHAKWHPKGKRSWVRIRLGAKKLFFPFFISDFMWNQFLSFWSLKNCHFDHMSSSEFWIFGYFWYSKVWNSQKSQNSYPPKLLKLQLLTLWNRPKLISHKITVAKKWLNFHTVDYPIHSQNSQLGCPGDLHFLNRIPAK